MVNLYNANGFYMLLCISFSILFWFLNTILYSFQFSEDDLGYRNVRKSLTFDAMQSE